MLSWLGKKVLTRSMARTSAGDYSMSLQMSRQDVEFRFPGDSSWGGAFHGKRELEPWLQRFVDAGIQISPDEVVVKGMPWKATVCVRGTDYLNSPEGETVYENRYVIWGHMAWGKLTDYEVYEDTQAAAALDEYLESREPAAV